MSDRNTLPVFIFALPSPLGPRAGAETSVASSKKLADAAEANGGSRDAALRD